jgi:DNA-binding response OmpR family regulator
MESKILLVEDEKKTGEMLIKALKLEDIEVEWSMDGNEALSKVEKGKYDLIILDLKLPGITGDDLLVGIRKKDPYVQVIIYTNYLEPPVMKKLINLGIDGYINKGAAADLWDTVKVIKSKLDPFSDDEIDKLINSTPDKFLKDEKKD